MYVYKKKNGYSQCLFFPEGCLYMTGGTGPCENGVVTVHTSTVSCYVVESNTWFSVCGMNQARSCHVTVTQGLYSSKISQIRLISRLVQSIEHWPCNQKVIFSIPDHHQLSV